MKNAFTIPKEVSRVTETLQNAGFEAYFIGGCVRDLIRGEKPKDWDVTTNATPDKIEELFEKTFYENSFGTVGVVNEETEDETLKIVEVTPYRIEGKYSDSRRPDEVKFSDKLEDDLKRRDFTINAIAYDNVKGQIVDLYKGQEDIKDKVIRTVDNAEERFEEDALRILRAVRLATELGFTCNTETEKAIKKLASTLKNISIERIRDEFIKIVMSANPMDGLVLANKLGILKYFLPELENGVGIEQNGDHIYTVWEHNLRAVQHSADRQWPLHVRLGALFHDISKPETRRWSKEKNNWTFYGHDVVGAKVTRETLTRLKFPKEIVSRVTKLVRYHLFFSDVEQITLSAVRRIVVNVGPENIWDLMNVRACDRIGMGRPKEIPYRLRKYEAMIEEAMRAPISVGMLKIDGKKIMEVTRETPGPKIGLILYALLEEVLDDPTKNTETFLTKRSLELVKLPIDELKKLGEGGRDKQEEEDAKKVAEIRGKYHVK